MAKSFSTTLKEPLTFSVRFKRKKIFSKQLEIGANFVDLESVIPADQVGVYRFYLHRKGARPFAVGSMSISSKA